MSTNQPLTATEPIVLSELIAPVNEHATALDILLAEYGERKHMLEVLEMELKELKGKMQEHLGYFGDKYASAAGSVTWRAGSVTRNCDYRVIDATAMALDGINPILAGNLRKAITTKQGAPTLVVIPNK